MLRRAFYPFFFTLELVSKITILCLLIAVSVKKQGWNEREKKSQKELSVLGKHHMMKVTARMDVHVIGNSGSQNTTRLKDFTLMKWLISVISGTGTKTISKVSKKN